MRRFVLLVAMAGCAYVRPPSGDDSPAGTDAAPTPAPDAAPATTVPLRDCTTHFHYTPPAPVTSVALAGQWDWTARIAMTVDGSGTYSVDRDLDPGLYAYKFVVTHTDGTVEWLEDPANPYRAYDGGTENSGMRVPDCATPLVQIVSHDATTTKIQVERGRGGAAITALTASLRHDGASTAVPIGEPDASGVATITLGTLADGKYTLAIDATDAAGASADTQLVPFWIEAQPFDWKGALVYMVMTDRFRDGDTSNDPAPSPGADPAADYHGGDLKGVTQAIEDGTFDSLGVGALWLSPWVQNTTAVEDDGGHGVTGYHGYWPIHPRAIDPRLGTEADLDELVRTAHQHGIRVLMDFVINHVHQDHEYVQAHPDWFRQGCICGDPNCDWTTHRLDCMFHPYMPDVNWTNNVAGEQFIEDALWWLERFDLDGLRIDAVKHVEDAAIYDLSTRVHEKFEQGGDTYFLLGETAMGWEGDQLAANMPDYDLISHYIGPTELNGQFDFVLYHASAYRVWADDAKGMLHLDYWTRMSQAQYPAGAIMTPFIGSHDTERILSLAQYTSSSATVHDKWTSDSAGLPVPPTSDEPYDRVAIAMAWLLTTPGMPLLDYGDEYGEYGGADPDNRHMWEPPSARNARQDGLYARVARAATLRKQLAPLRLGDYTPLTVTEDVLSFARSYQGDTVVVAINKAATAQTVDIAPALADGTLLDRLDPGGRTFALSGGHVSVTLAPRSAAVLTEN